MSNEQNVNYNWISTWTDSIDNVLNKIRINSIHMSDLHNKRYHTYKFYFMSFRMPLILLSAINSFSAVALQRFTTQENISLINALISLFCGVLTSVELLINIQKKMETELSSEKDYYKLSIEIFKVISLNKDKRMMDGKTFLDQKCNDYIKLIESSDSIKYTEYIFLDELAPTPENMNNNNNFIYDIVKYIKQNFTSPKRLRSNKDIELGTKYTDSDESDNETNKSMHGSDYKNIKEEIKKINKEYENTMNKQITKTENNITHKIDDNIKNSIQNISIPNELLNDNKQKKDDFKKYINEK